MAASESRMALAREHPAVREAARGMGMTDWQMLRQVELPLALSVIVAGVRVATVISVGTATIAAAIGAGGLGTYIFRGLRTVDRTLILAGAIPAALMALGADFGLGSLERLLSPGSASAARRRQRWALAIGAIAIIATLVIFASLSALSKDGARVIVGSKDFTESRILSELIAQTIEAKDYAAFSRDLMERGTLIPSSTQFTKQAEAWRANSAAVWRGQTSPENAARNVEGAR